MESSSALALADLNVVIEDEGDYVFVAGDFDDDDNGLLDEWEDDESYDHCHLSPSLSCATSVATNITLKDLNLIEDSAVMMDIDDDGPTPMDTEDARDEGSSNRMMNGTARNHYPSSMANPKNGRRISNKKLRKKMKHLKKVAAAKAAAEAIVSQKASIMTDFSSWGSNVASPKRKPRSVRLSSSNLAVACAQESLAAYREEIEAGKAQKKTRAVSIDVP
eukprot:CAMPEP_0172323748 /NCGR_PEP_ID=MMETSP1058-20130122/49478_1 /TAXON_ID=83371 /ORGANISM="Detonula confervacea, Strain CCMP 353" /LENGTH=219 /DNA_ID=CAMNT_0013039827 /DNA_START=66 /DNA_END=725 /DNA_ORIENTATION=+